MQGASMRGLPRCLWSHQTNDPASRASLGQCNDTVMVLPRIAGESVLWPGVISLIGGWESPAPWYRKGMSFQCGGHLRKGG